jgi:hypothetical protein
MVVFCRIIGSLLIRNTKGNDDTQNLKIVEESKSNLIQGSTWQD